MTDARDPMEMAAREIAKTNIPAYADDEIWAEDWPMYLRRAARQDLSGVDNPIATARAGVLAWLEALEPKEIAAPICNGCTNGNAIFADAPEHHQESWLEGARAVLNALKAKARGT